MILTTAILNEAEKWLGCTETKQNRSVCVDEIHKLFSDGWNGQPDAWCAKFVWTMTETATKKLKVENPLFKSASTVTMLNKTNLRKDSTAAKGSIFFINRTCDGGGSGCGHVGFVEKVDGNIIHTLEGNTGGPEGVYRKMRDAKQTKFTFIHIEDLDTIENNINALLEPFSLEIGDKKLWYIVGIAGIAVTGAVIYKRLH
jgi:hypothetical protein